MKDTDRKARHGMMLYVAVIAMIAAVLAVFYMVVVHPGAPATESTTSSNVHDTLKLI